MPRNRLSLAVFIGCEPNVFGPNGFYLLFQFGNHLLFFRIYLVGGFKAIFYVNWRRAVLRFFNDRANMPHAR